MSLTSPSREADTMLIATAIREELARRHVTRQWLADEARISLSTLEKGLTGRRPFSLETLVRIEDVLGISLRLGSQGPAIDPGGSRSNNEGVARDELGSYARAAVSWIEGDYLTLRPSFSNAAAIYAYRTQIAWDEARNCLTFSETDRSDAEFAQYGDVSMPNQTGHLYLVTNRHGQFRLAVLSRPTIDEHLFGLLTTLRVGEGSHLAPVSTPIALAKASGDEKFAEDRLGKVGHDHPLFESYRKILSRAEADGYVNLLGMPV